MRAVDTDVQESVPPFEIRLRDGAVAVVVDDGLDYFVSGGWLGGWVS